MTSNDAGATSNSINSPTAPLLTQTLSPAPSLMPSPVSTTSDSPNRRPFSDGLLRTCLRLAFEFGTGKPSGARSPGPVLVLWAIGDELPLVWESIQATC